MNNQFIYCVSVAQGQGKACVALATKEYEYYQGIHAFYLLLNDKSYDDCIEYGFAKVYLIKN